MKIRSDYFTYVLIIICVMFLFSCSTKKVVETEYTSGGKLSYAAEKENGKIITELRRVFYNTRIEGIGIFESTNEGLARRTATQLAVAELAGKVQTLVQSETVIYNNEDVRDVVENRVKSLVQNYKIESAGYDPGTSKFRVRISISGEQISREIETKIIK